MPPLTRKTVTAAVGQLVWRSFHLTSEQLLQLRSSPVEVVPAPGDGRIAWPLHAFSVLTIGTADYTVGGSDHALLNWLEDWRNGQGSGQMFQMMTDVLTAGGYAVGTKKLTRFEPNPYAGHWVWDQAQAADQPVVLVDDGDDPTGGNGTLDITVGYIVLDAA